MTQIVSMIGLGLALLLVQPAFARDKIPTTVVEARAQLDPWFFRNNGRPPKYKTPPGNVRAEDYHALFGNTVIVVDQGRAPVANWKKGAPHHAIKIIWIGANGRYIWCARGGKQQGGPSEDGTDQPWAATKVKASGGLTPLLDPAFGTKGWGLSPLYDGATGEIIWYTNWKRHWWAWNVGHVQKNLPRMVYTLCPAFPSAAALGTGVNEKQTAITYPELIAQDRGQRILRPDLITPNPVEPIE
ncbi:hypothetical protein [Ruegeria sp.]|uniref:hypothetical protein n=1 Tax=Ruegeria sp. TaxID=1879320 RepID=UPI003B0049AD